MISFRLGSLDDEMHVLGMKLGGITQSWDNCGPKLQDLLPTIDVFSEGPMMEVKENSGPRRLRYYDYKTDVPCQKHSNLLSRDQRRQTAKDPSRW